MKYYLNKKRRRINRNRGFTIVEVIVACAIISMTTLALMSTTQKGIELSSRAVRQVQANYLLEEGAEAVKSIRDNNWGDIANLTLNNQYSLFFDTNTNLWLLSSPPPIPMTNTPKYPIDSVFNREIVISPVYRNSNDDISKTGVLDNGTKKITVTVSWASSSGGVISRSLVFYLANIFN